MSDTMTKSDAETRPEYIYTDDGDHELFSHYVKKEAILRAQVEGIPCRALCGKLWLPSKDEEKYPVCPECKDIYENVVQP